MKERVLTWELYRSADHRLIKRFFQNMRLPLDGVVAEALPTHLLNGDAGYWLLLEGDYLIARIPVSFQESERPS